MVITVTMKLKRCKQMNISNREHSEMGALTYHATMNNYTFNVYMSQEEVLCETVSAPSRLVGELIIAGMYPRSIFCEFISMS